MLITRETDYGIRCVLHLALSPEERLSMDEISRARDIPKSFLAKILQKLTKKNIVVSYRGVKGGFGLAKSPADINLYDVITAIQGPIGLNQCAVDSRLCHFSPECVVHPIWVMLREDVSDVLRKYDFKRLAALAASGKD